MTIGVKLLEQNLPISEGCAAVLLERVVPWHVYAKRNTSARGMAWKLLAALRRAGRLRYDESGRIVSCRMHQVAVAHAGWGVLVRLLKRGAPVTYAQIPQLKPSTVCVYLRVMQKLGLISCASRVPRECLVEYHWHGDESSTADEIAARVHELRKKKRRHKKV